MKIKQPFNKDEVFFTSDTHFLHSNIIKYCSRPFIDVREMDKTLIERWNQVVPDDGIVFHLGDVALKARQQSLDEILSQLNGTKYLVIGNHEKAALSSHHIRRHWKDIADILEIEVEDEEITYKKQPIVMCHYPMISWNGSHRGSWQLFGHVHGGLSNKGDLRLSPNQMDVGVDTNYFHPYSWLDVKTKITLQNMQT